MRQKAELFKFIQDPEDEMKPNQDEENQEVGLIRAERSNAESIGFHNVNALARPVRETEVSLVRMDQHLVSLHEYDPESAGQYTRLATSLIVAAHKTPPLKRVLITSAHHAEGRTCVLLNMAAALARARKRVLVVDTDLLRPSVSRLLGVDTEIGLVEALTEGIPPEATILRIQPACFDILPTRSQFMNSAEMLSSPDFGQFLAELDPYYDFILFDSSPLLSSADASLLVLHTHTTLMVVRPGMTTTSQMAKAIAQLSEDSLFGVVLNRVSG